MKSVEYECVCILYITQDGWSALMSAANQGMTDVVVELVKTGANVDMQDKVCHTLIIVQFMIRNTAI